jgi:hypothetical protein
MARVREFDSFYYTFDANVNLEILDNASRLPFGKR